MCQPKITPPVLTENGPHPGKNQWNPRLSPPFVSGNSKLVVMMEKKSLAPRKSERNKANLIENNQPIAQQQGIGLTARKLVRTALPGLAQNTSAIISGISVGLGKGYCDIFLHLHLTGLSPQLFGA